MSIYVKFKHPLHGQDRFMAFTRAGQAERFLADFPGAKIVQETPPAELVLKRRPPSPDAYDRQLQRQQAARDAVKAQGGKTAVVNIDDYSALLLEDIKSAHGLKNISDAIALLARAAG